MFILPAGNILRLQWLSLFFSYCSSIAVIC